MQNPDGSGQNDYDIPSNGAGLNVGGDKSTMLGSYAGYYTTGSYNTFVGQAAGQGGTTSAPYSSGQYNTALGFEALKYTTTGADDSVAVGYRALGGD